ncbi:MAG TPA: flagellin [Allosphingosinicella sp.]|jgi:flagellar hook-associated protein 3 FlgL
MTRVATIPIQRNLASAIQRSQQKLAETQLQLATGKKAHDYASLGTETVRHISARTIVARHEAHTLVAERVSTTLSLYDAHLTGIDDSTTDLRTKILTAVGTEQSAGLQEAIEQAFQQFRSSLNAAEGGLPMFAGSRTDEAPFHPKTLAEVATTNLSDAFTDDTIRASARVADSIDVEYGALASEVGSDLYLAFKKLAEAGTIGDKPTAAQMTALKEATDLIDTGLVSLRTANAENGRKQNQIEGLGERAYERTMLLMDLIGKNEDADLAQVATDLAQQQTTLKASFSVFSQLSGLTLSDYLR